MDPTLPVTLEIRDLLKSRNARQKSFSTVQNQFYGAPCVKLRNIKFCIIFLVKLHAISYIVAIYLYCKKTLKSPFNCHADMLTKTVSVALSLFP